MDLNRDTNIFLEIRWQQLQTPCHPMSAGWDLQLVVAIDAAPRAEAQSLRLSAGAELDLLSLAMINGLLQWIHTISICMLNIIYIYIYY